MERQTSRVINEVIRRFHYNGELIDYSVYGSGHINDTFLLQFRRSDGTIEKQILQMINRNVFKNPAEVMDNIQGITTFLRKKIKENGGDPERETLNLRMADDGRSYYIDQDGNYWRSFGFIDGASCYDRVENNEYLYQSAAAFGNFQYLLADYPVQTLHETIKGFHDTAARFDIFCQSVRDDICGRVSQAEAEIRFIMEHQETAYVFENLIKDGQLPLRVTHNDTKLNNIMIDDLTGKAVCIIDLDTVMPGLAAYDFGDLIRFGANTAAEDEKDLSKISCNMNLFDLCAKGYIEGCAGKLSNLEISLLPMGAKVMTFECGMRFLTDFLQGDIYFKIHRKEHNLDRCRTQLKLVEDMEQKWNIMESIISRYM